MTTKIEEKSGLQEGEAEDTDSDGMDCLVANESLQISTNERCRKKSIDIRRITKRTSFVSINHFKRNANVRSFCSTKVSGAAATNRAPKPGNFHQAEKVNNWGSELLSHNSSPVQDEMTVNMAIRGASSKNGQQRAVRVFKNLPSSGVRTDNQNVPLLGSESTDQDMTVVVSAAMVLSENTILKAAEYSYKVHNSEKSVTESSLMETNPQGKNFSVNLPYPSKPTLHTNMGTFQTSKRVAS